MLGYIYNGMLLIIHNFCILESNNNNNTNILTLPYMGIQKLYKCQPIICSPLQYLGGLSGNMKKYTRVKYRHKNLRANKREIEHQTFPVSSHPDTRATHLTQVISFPFQPLLARFHTPVLASLSKRNLSSSILLNSCASLSASSSSSLQQQ